MADERWEEQFKQFLRKTGDDFRRAGEDVKAEAQRLFDAAVDPQKQQRVRDRLKELTGWARKTAEDVAGMVETAASKAEQVFHRTSDKAGEAAEKVSPAAPRSSARASKKAAAGKAKGGKPAQKSAGKRKR
jgi:DNA repair ATPase RecN